MTTIDPATTLGDLVTAHPHLARDIEPHLLKEERVLFPMVRDSTPPPSRCRSTAAPCAIRFR